LRFSWIGRDIAGRQFESLSIRQIVRKTSM
jgi:hypothetical protein